MKKFLLILLLVALFVLGHAIDYEELLSSSSTLNYSIHVVGAVKNPGLYLVPPNARVSTAIKLANTISDTLNIPVQTVLNPSSRRVILRRAEEDRNLDMKKFLTFGAISENPFVKDGDVIIVPAAKDYIYISGAVNMKLYEENIKMELIEGDKISDIIQLTYGLDNGIDSENCYIERFSDDSIALETIYFSANEIISDPTSKDNVYLKNGDRIYIRQQPDFHKKRYITIEGEVKYPGEYAIELGKTTLSQILKKSGGPTAKADLENSYLFRISKEDITYKELNHLRYFSFVDLSTPQYRYLRQMISEKRSLIREDFAEIYNDEKPENDVVLKDRDRIFVSAKKSVISVNGEVKTPGLYNFVEGKEFSYYIEQAGGTIKPANKSKIQIIRGDSGEWVKAKHNTKIYVGDTIYVPRGERFSYYWPYIKDTVTFVTGLATSIVVIKGLVGN